MYSVSTQRDGEVQFRGRRHLIIREHPCLYGILPIQGLSASRLQAPGIACGQTKPPLNAQSARLHAVDSRLESQGNDFPVRLLEMPGQPAIGREKIEFRKRDVAPLSLSVKPPFQIFRRERVSRARALDRFADLFHAPLQLLSAYDARLTIRCSRIGMARDVLA